jgi:hypothetical protein
MASVLNLLQDTTNTSMTRVLVLAKSKAGTREGSLLREDSD